MVDEPQEFELAADADDDSEAYKLNKRAVDSILYAVEIDDAAKLLADMVALGDHINM